MDTHQLMGYISGILVFGSIIPYSIRVWQKKITPSPTSWALWAGIGLALLLTYNSAGATDSIWPALFGFINPTLITFLIWKRQKGRFNKITEKTDLCCLIFGIASMILWGFMRKNLQLAQFALYVAIAADLFAVIPTVTLYWGDPLQDRPFAWGCYSVGYGLAIFAISDHTISNYVLPIYMCVGSMSVAMILTIFRIKKRIPFKEWI